MCTGALQALSRVTPTHHQYHCPQQSYKMKSQTQLLQLIQWWYSAQRKNLSTTMQLLHDLRSMHETHTTFKVSSTNAAVFLQLVKITSLDIFLW